MNKRIFQSIFLVAFLVLISCFALIMGLSYDYLTKTHKAELKNESAFLVDGINQSGIVYLNKLAHVNNRITWIAADGVVLYDSDVDAATLENHINREEVQEALTEGVGESSRYSSTLAENTYYYAVLLTDGSVIRISSVRSSVFALTLNLLKPGLLILLFSIILSAFLASKISGGIVKPILNIDLEHPERAEIYDELAPLLRRITLQNNQIKNQIQELSRKQQEFTTITENMTEGLLVVDHKTDILSYNTSALKLLSAKINKEMKSVLTLNRSEGFRRAIDTALAGTHNEQTITLNSRQYRLFANPVLQETAVVGAVIVILDITEKEEREQLRREFTANVSHELKTPLTSISGFAEIIQNGLVKKEDIPKFAGNIYEESKRLITLIGDIIKLSQLDENSVSMEKEQVNLPTIINDVISRLKTAADAKQVTFELQLEPVTIVGVAQVLDEMIYNLCDNAVKYNKDSGKISIKLTNESNQIKLIVADTGIGIPYADQERVFERFYRVDKSHSKEIGGTGLGLSIVKHSASFHGASVNLVSTPNEGTTITIIFPQKQA